MLRAGRHFLSAFVGAPVGEETPLAAILLMVDDEAKEFHVVGDS